MKTIKRGPSLRSQMLMSAAAVAMGVALFGASSQAQAQTPFNWSGFYVGGNIGIGSTKFRSSISEEASKSAKGFTGGLQAGYNWQMGSFVLGGEVDLSAASMSTHLSDNVFHTDLLASLRARLGFAFDRVMIYGTGGMGLVSGRVYSSGNGKKGFSKLRPVVGAGVEFALTSNLLLRAEVLDYLGSKTKLPNEDEGGNNMDSTWVTRVGFSYKF